ncbi:MAG TPA: hypothetical protein VM911_13115 [Pyrinomonadaceae bacterium]|jgi:predicted KAP-like P-loop ATPase|nr:hypothetical protein [Pyrinomonadaceae bacterium]
MTKKIIEITVETERLVVVHRRNKAVRGWCERCDSEVEMVTPVEAALIAGFSPSVIRRMVEEGAIHSGFTAEGEEVLCLKSLSENVQAGL